MIEKIYAEWLSDTERNVFLQQNIQWVTKLVSKKSIVLDNKAKNHKYVLVTMSSPSHFLSLQDKDNVYFSTAGRSAPLLEEYLL